MENNTETKERIGADGQGSSVTGEAERSVTEAKQPAPAGQTVRKAVSYGLGLVMIAIGINATKLAQIGISPTSSFPRAVEAVTGMTLGTATTLVCVLLVFVQAAILRKRFKLINIIGVPISIVFGWIVDIFGTDPKAFGHLMAGVPRPETYPMKLLYYVVGILILSMGVYLYSRVNWVLMPTDGVGWAFAEVTGKNFGDCKSVVDCGLVLCALILQLVFLGGLKSFTENVVVREGTVVAAVAVGQLIKLWHKLFDKKTDKTNES